MKEQRGKGICPWSSRLESDGAWMGPDRKQGLLPHLTQPWCQQHGTCTQAQSLLPAEIFVAPKQSQSRRPCKQSSLLFHNLIHDLWYAASEEYFPAWNVLTPSSYTLAQCQRAKSEQLEFLGIIVTTSDHPREMDLVVPQASKRGLRRPRAQEHVSRLKESADDKWEKTFQTEWI